MSEEEKENIEFEESEIIRLQKNINEAKLNNKFTTFYQDLQRKVNSKKILLNLIEKQQEELKEKDNIVKKIINRLENDIKNIKETKVKKKDKYGYLDDYTRCRLNAYRTKTRELKEYIEKEYFKENN